MHTTPWNITKSQLTSPGGIVVCQHWKAAEAGAATAASTALPPAASMAAALTLSVVEPWLSGIGGGGFMVVRDGPSGVTRALDFGICASARLNPADYPLEDAADDGDWFHWPRVKDGRNIHGYASIGVPGAVAGLAEALKTLGTLPWEQVIEPAIAEAEAGLELDWMAALALAMDTDMLLRYPESAALWLPEGRVSRVSAGARPSRLPLTAKLATLKRLRKAGPQDFYTGELAHALVEDLRKGGSPIDLDDLAAYRPEWKEPLHGAYRGWDLALMPGNSAGPSLLRALENLERGLNPSSSRPGAEEALLYSRVCREEYEYRLTHMGQSAVPGSRPDPSCTSNLCVVDRHGTVVALTNTLLSRFGSKVTSSLGMLLNNGIMWFDPMPGHPNSIMPGIRPLSNMCPLVASRAGGERYAFGAAGGRTIFPTLLQILSYVFDFNMSLEEAFLEPRLDASTETIRISSRADPSVAAKVSEVFPAEVVDDAIYPTRFSLPSAVRHDPSAGLNTGMAHHNSPWAAAVAEIAS